MIGGNSGWFPMLTYHYRKEALCRESVPHGKAQFTHDKEVVVSCHWHTAHSKVLAAKSSLP
jgi:hypothetical protein